VHAETDTKTTLPKWLSNQLPTTKTSLHIKTHIQHHWKRTPKIWCRSAYI
jgi:hypothetical protein